MKVSRRALVAAQGPVGVALCAAAAAVIGGLGPALLVVGVALLVGAWVSR